MTVAQEFNQYKQRPIVFIKAGEDAFKARIPFYNNPYRVNPFRSFWIRGWKRAELEFNEQIRRSKAFLETLPLEEVEA